MTKGKTLFILGAGASISYGFPTGAQLYDKIANGEYLDLYDDFLQNADIPSSKISSRFYKAKEFAEHVKLATNKSIDFFLSNNPQYLSYGKEAISLLMLKYEKESIDEAFSIDDKNDWLTILFQKCIENIREPDDFENNSISFITFNYERSLEYFLHQKLVNSYTQINKSILEESLNKIPFYHVYGKIGKLEWENDSKTTELDYGWDYEKVSLDEIRKSINVMYTERYGGDVIPVLRHPIEIADRIFILGFSYDKDNLHIIDFYNEIMHTRGKKIYGTAIGITNKQIEELIEYCGDAHKIILKDNMNCRELLYEYL